MKKIVTALTAFCMIFMAAVLVAACGAGDGITRKDGGTAVYNASLTGWWTSSEAEGEHLIDTSVTLNFDEIKISDIKKITFEIFKDDASMGKAVSEGEKLEALFNEAKIYWKKTGDSGNYAQGDDYSQITGDGRVLSCNFYEIENAEDATHFTDIWTYTTTNVHYVDGSHGDGETFPNKLVVKVLAGNVEYTTSTQAD